MKCVICKQGETHPGQATVTLQRGETTVIIKDVPDTNITRFYLLSVLLGLGVFRALSGVKVRLHDLICAFPFSYLFLEKLHAHRKTLLRGVILAQLTITVLFPTHVHRHDGVPSGDYGRTSRSQRIP